MLCFHASLIGISPSVHTTLHALGTLRFQKEPFEIAFHCAIVPLNLMLVSPVQPEKANKPMLVTPLPIVTLVSPLQSLKAELPMLITLSGIVMLVSPVQPLKA